MYNGWLLVSMSLDEVTKALGLLHENAPSPVGDSREYFSATEIHKKREKAAAINTSTG